MCALKIQTKLCLLMLYAIDENTKVADPFRTQQEGQIYREDPGRGRG